MDSEAVSNVCRLFQLLGHSSYRALPLDWTQLIPRPLGYIVPEMKFPGGATESSNDQNSKMHTVLGLSATNLRWQLDAILGSFSKDFDLKTCINSF